MTGLDAEDGFKTDSSLVDIPLGNLCIVFHRGIIGVYDKTCQRDGSAS